VLTCILSGVVLKVIARNARVDLHWMHQIDNYTLRQILNFIKDGKSLF
jgi:hypothetical protein